MNDNSPDLGSFDPSIHDRGASSLKFAVWTVISNIVFRNSFVALSSFKVTLLRVFGARIGDGVVIKPNVSIRYPWKLAIGNNCWIGEAVWIENVANVTVGDNVCLSQNAFILAGSHDHTKTSFDENSKPIIISNGVWLGARTVVCSGVTCHTNSILSVNSVATRDLDSNSIYMGNPAVFVKKRIIT